MAFKDFTAGCHDFHAVLKKYTTWEVQEETEGTGFGGPIRSEQEQETPQNISETQK